MFELEWKRNIQINFNLIGHLVIIILLFIFKPETNLLYKREIKIAIILMICLSSFSPIDNSSIQKEMKLFLSKIKLNLIKKSIHPQNLLKKFMKI